jgi:polysaccharide export outer membrane protein
MPVRTGWIAIAMALLTAAANFAVAQDTPPAQTAPADNQYVIGPGDTLNIFVWNHPELTVQIPVRPDGQISTPLVENMVAAGKTPSRLARDLEEKLTEYVRSPTVNVIVTTPLSTFSQVKVIGQVAKPQALSYHEGMKVMDAILAAGGLSQYAAGNRAKIVRTEGGKEKEIRVRAEDLFNKGDLSQNLALKPGDVVVIPQSRF